MKMKGWLLLLLIVAWLVAYLLLTAWVVLLCIEWFAR